MQPTPVAKLFDWNPSELGSPEWNLEIFNRAYRDDSGTGHFDTVLRRLKLNFSVLVYLPGNCIRAATDAAGGEREWKIYGRPKKPGDGIPEIFKEYAGLYEIVANWISGDATTPPRAIFENLDLLDDGHGGLDPGPDARTALFYLKESIRNGVVLGLSDIHAGELPDPVRRAFAEEVWLDEVSLDRFPLLLPRKLGRSLFGASGQIGAGAAWSLASRLRWTDPIRAVRIMVSVGECDDLGQVLKTVTEATRTADFRSPTGVSPLRPTGFEDSTLDLIENTVIGPFKRWAQYAGSDGEGELRKLTPGMILFGPPGTGKTMLAQWVAESIGLPVRQVGAADLKRADWGLTERLVRDLFRSARRAAPCVVVLDDADDLLPDRNSLEGGLASAERGVVNAFLQEVQGFGGSLEGVLVILTTNRYANLDVAAKARLPLHLRIPYPLTRPQVSQIVGSAERHYRLNLEGTDAAGVPLRQRLEDFFFDPLTTTASDTNDPAVRREMDRSLFSPREILAAMRLLVPAVGDVPSSEDVARMRRYYETLALTLSE